MRYFLDTEFSERGPKHPIELISIGVVAEDGREFYIVNADFDPAHANDWVREHVLPHVNDPDVISPYHLIQIPTSIRWFIGDDDAPEFWGYYCQFDFVIFQQLFGDMSRWPTGWPTGWPMYCNDLRAWLDWEALNHIEQPDDAPHNALDDARWIRETFQTYSDAAKGY